MAGVRPGGRLPFFAGAKKGSKESTRRRAVVGVAIGRCAPGGGLHGLAQQALDRAPKTGGAAPPTTIETGKARAARRQWWCGVGVPPRVGRAAARSAPLVYGRLSSACCARPGMAPAGAQRPMPTSTIARLQVLSLLPFFAPAKKGSRPPGRNPGQRYSANITPPKQEHPRGINGSTTDFPLSIH